MTHHPDAPDLPTILTAEAAKIFEQPEARVEGRLKVTGGARYTADLKLPGMLEAKYLLSPLPHARIVSIDTSAAQALPGVHAVLTGADVAGKRFGRNIFDWPVLADGKVLFAGERVAVVAAESREIAEQAIALIEVEYEELEAVLDAQYAVTDSAPILHPDSRSYHVESLIGASNRPWPPLEHANLQGYTLVNKGDPDIEKAFAQADRVFEDSYTAPRQHQGYIEPHASVVWVQDDGAVRVWSVNKSPFGLRRQLSIVTGEPLENIVVDCMFIGADFGGKGFTMDEFSLYYLSKATGRPVKSVMTYAEELGACNPRHNTVIRLRTGVMNDGRIVAHEYIGYYNGGAYAAPKPMMWPMPGWSCLQAYNIPNTRMEQFVSYTNTTPAGHVRAPGAVQMGSAGEGHIDRIARELGIDPLELRMKNALREGDRGLADEGFKNPRAVAVLETIKNQTNWGKPLAPNRGRGLALLHREVGQGKTGIILRLREDGKIDALYGTPDQGSGSQTVVRRVASAVLSVSPDRIMPRYGTTAEAPLDPGAGASRVTHIMGRATISGATTLKLKLEELTAELQGWPVESVKLENDEFISGEGDRVSFEEMAAKIVATGSVEVKGEYDSAHVGPGPHADDYNFYAYMIEVEVDPDTGQVTIEDAVMAADVGTIINPIAHAGQLEGSYVYGVGHAMMEEMVVEDGRITNVNLGEYKMPTQMDLPPLRVVYVPTEIGPGPFGAKSVGETVNSGVAPAITNAVYAATGVRLMTIPVTAERVYDGMIQSSAEG
ncbi:MAG: xanthine dehydrogenase family protein molybdopterin-binding subunit [Chloroflexota bacterium]